jgi:signal transduction histidine kinase
MFALGVFLPGTVLAGLGFVALVQDRQALGQQRQDRLDRAAERAIGSLDRELRRWDDDLGEWPGRPATPAAWPAAIRDAVERPGAAALVEVHEAVEVVPPTAVLSSPRVSEASEASSGTPPEVRAGETLELVRRDYAAAIALYRRLLESGRAPLRPWALHRLARTLTSAGRRDEAATAYAELERVDDARLGGVPASLVGAFGRCALDRPSPSARSSTDCAVRLYGDLVRGRWQLDESRYSYYSELGRGWARAVPAAKATFDETESLERRKRALTDAVVAAIGALRARPPAKSSARLIVDTPAGVALALWNPGNTADGGRLLVLSSTFLTEHVWPAAFGAAAAENVFVRLLAPGGATVLGPPAGVPDPPTASHEQLLQEHDQIWGLRVWPQDASRYFSDLTRRGFLYLSMFVLVVASLAVGSALTVRGVKRELEVSRLKSQFVSAVSHEFRSPLTGIRQLSELLVRGRVDDEARRQKYYGMILRESDRLSHLIEHVLDFARMEDGRKPFEFETIETSQWLRDVAAAFQDRLSAKQQRLDVSVPADVPWIAADREALSGAVQNLLDNAAKYSPEGATVWLEAEATARHVLIRVRDRGAGISRDDQPHVFDRFFRGSGAADVAHGSGLGLSLVRHVVDAHRGTVTCASTLREGSTFTIELPVVPLA